MDVMNHDRTIKFKSSILYGGNIFSRDVIEIDDVFITLRRKQFFSVSHKSMSIPLRNVINVGITNTFAGVNVMIESVARRHFNGRGFSEKAGKEINEAINSFKKFSGKPSRG
jgi:hypothetical protein